MNSEFEGINSQKCINRLINSQLIVNRLIDLVIIISLLQFQSFLCHKTVEIMKGDVEKHYKSMNKKISSIKFDIFGVEFSKEL